MKKGLLALALVLLVALFLTPGAHGIEVSIGIANESWWPEAGALFIESADVSECYTCAIGLEYSSGEWYSAWVTRMRVYSQPDLSGGFVGFRGGYITMTVPVSDYYTLTFSAPMIGAQTGYSLRAGPLRIEAYATWDSWAYQGASYSTTGFGSGIKIAW